MPQVIENIPESLLHKLSEFSDGFILFAITPKKTVAVHTCLNDDIAALALRKSIEMFVEQANNADDNIVITEDEEEEG